ncbi:MAG: tyrosine-type recombinase/integrase [Bryobacterales bacterium]|nr:tyrosine-type recombinase/integrase [Bryobacterales bacterium]
MLNIFRRHIGKCPYHGKRTGQKCPRKPPCPIHFEGVDGQGRYGDPKRLIDPRTQNGVRDWARACEIIRDKESPTPILVAETRTTIEQALKHYETKKSNRSEDRKRKIRIVLSRMAAFMAANPRNYQFITEIRHADLTDWIATWKGASTTRDRDQSIVQSFFKYCNRADFITKNVADGLDPIENDNEAKEPFTPEELEQVWAALPNLPDEYGRLGQPIAEQTAAFAYVMRYTGLAVSDVVKLKKSAVQGNRIMTYRKKTGGDVWTMVPEWVVDILMAAPHDSEAYFFWSGEGKLHTRASKWFSRLRKLLDLAGLPHRSPHRFRHFFAVELILADVPIDGVSRLLGHKSIKTTERYYLRWIQARQMRLEDHLRRVWSGDPLTRRMKQSG